jgi:hypothetical protein
MALDDVKDLGLRDSQICLKSFASPTLLPAARCLLVTRLSVLTWDCIPRTIRLLGVPGIVVREEDV